jgi:TPR repeat protein
MGILVSIVGLVALMILLATVWGLVDAGRAYRKELKDPEAVNQMGVESMRRGELGPASLRFRHAAEMGHAGATFNLALMFFNGAGVKQSYAEAYKGFRFAAEHGLVNGRYRVGLCYLHGHGVEKDLAKAYYSLKLAAEQGFEPAFKHVEEFEESVEEGWEIMERFSESPEESQARRRAVIWYLRGLGSIDGLERAVAAGDRDSAFNLAMMYFTGNHVPEKDRQRAYEWMKQAAAMGNVKAALLLKSIQPNLQVSLADLKTTMDLSDRAAEGDEASRYEIGRRYLEGIKVDPDPTAAALWFLLSHNYPPSRSALQSVPREQWPEDVRDVELPPLA